MPETAKILISDGKLLHDFSIFSGRSLAELAKFFLRGKPDVYGARALIEELRSLRAVVDAIESRAQNELPKGDSLREREK